MFKVAELQQLKYVEPYFCTILYLQLIHIINIIIFIINSTFATITLLACLLCVSPLCLFVLALG